MAATTGLGVLFVVAVIVALAAAKGSAGIPDAVTGAGATGASTLVSLLAEAIATAEGFYKSNTIAQRQNNPGNVTDPASGCICTFPTIQEGWQALYDQINLMFSGGSAYYNSAMSIAEIGNIYANKDPNWSHNVAAYLGVPETTTLDELSAQYGG